MSGSALLVYSLFFLSGHKTVISASDSVAGSLRATMESANPGDTVNFSVAARDTFPLGDTLWIRKDLVLDGRSNAATGKRVVLKLDALKPPVPSLEVRKGKVSVLGLEILGNVHASQTVVLRLDGVEVGGAKSGAPGIRTAADTLLLSHSVVDSNQGGGVVQDSGVMIVEDTHFAGNTSSGYGGGVSIQPGAAASLRNSSFVGNHAASMGGAISNWGTTDVAGCRLEDNTAAHGGGIENSSRMHIIDSRFKKNSAMGEPGTWGGHGNGGAIYNSWNILIENCSIDSNIADSPGESMGYGGHAYGGGIFNGKRMTLFKSSLTKNSARGWGGGRDGYGGLAMGGGLDNDGKIHIDQCTFSGNQAKGDGSTYGGEALGGGLNNAGEMLIENSTLDGNSSEGTAGDAYGGDARGGGFSNSGHLNILNCTLYRNASTGHDGNPFEGSADAGALYNTGYAGILFSTLIGNTAEEKTHSYTYPGSSGIYNRDSIALAGSIILGGHGDSVDYQGKKWGVTIERGLKEYSVGSFDGTEFELFGDSAPALSDNGGPTLTIAVDSASIARGAAVLAGVCENQRTEDGTTWKYIIPVYFNGVEWKTLEKDSLVAADKVSIITTDQRGYLRPNPPGRGSFESGARVVDVRKRTRPSSDLSMRYLGRHGNRVSLFLPSKDEYDLSLFDVRGRLIFSGRYSWEAGPQNIDFVGKAVSADFILRVSGVKSRSTKIFSVR